MAYLRWISSNWYAYRHVDGGEGADALFMARYGKGAGVSVLMSAGEMRLAADRQPENWMRGIISALPGGDVVSPEDADELQEAAAAFMHEVFFAGLIPMPPAVAKRYRVLRRLVRRRVSRSRSPVETPGADESPNEALARLLRQNPDWAWIAEIQQIERRFPPPPMLAAIRRLHEERARRALAGEGVSDEHNDRELRMISEAQKDWPPPHKK